MKCRKRMDTVQVERNDQSLNSNYTFATLIDRFTSLRTSAFRLWSNQLIKFELLTQSIRLHKGRQSAVDPAVRMALSPPMEWSRTIALKRLLSFQNHFYITIRKSICQFHFIDKGTILQNKIAFLSLTYWNFSVSFHYPINCTAWFRNKLLHTLFYENLSSLRFFAIVCTKIMRLGNGNIWRCEGDCIGDNRFQKGIYRRRDISCSE